MNRHDFQAAADRAGINGAVYSLDGGLPSEKYVLALELGGWRVYYSEHGHRTDEHVFDTEDEACSYLLASLVQDPTTRVRLANGPQQDTVPPPHPSSPS